MEILFSNFQMMIRVVASPARHSDVVLPLSGTARLTVDTKESEKKLYGSGDRLTGWTRIDTVVV
jgi:hypothetical protein